MGWPYDGTRRWYVAYRRRNPGAKDYLGVLIRRQAELHRLIFAHGVSFILATSFGTKISNAAKLTRGTLLAD